MKYRNKSLYILLKILTERTSNTISFFRNLYHAFEKILFKRILSILKILLKSIEQN
jgi:hypothetical protein